ncbi:hypothetical protein Ndes2526B_g09202 [Nannochloris sp. 'desiccata']
MSKVTVALALVVLMASAASARVLLQDGRPSQCDLDTGSWDSDDINCDFTCNNQGWEVDCEIDDGNFIECKVDRDGAPDSEDVEFSCTFIAGQAPDCDFSALNAIDDSCVRSTVESVIGAWKPSNDDDNDDDSDD